MKLTSIIILTLNNLSKTKSCLESIQKFTTEPYELIVVDNGSVDETIPYLQQFPNIQLICNKENQGFAGGCNQGLKIAKGSQILLLNNDTIVSHNWLSNLLQALYSDEQVGLVGPLSNMTLFHQHRQYSYKSENEYHEFALQHNIHHPAKWKSVGTLSGFCMLIKRDVINKIGFLDEQYETGNFGNVNFFV